MRRFLGLLRWTIQLGSAKSIMLGLNEKPRQWPIPLKMITTADSLVGVEIDAVLGVAEGVAEMPFASVSMGGLGLVKGGGLSEIVASAKENLAQAAGDLGADAVVGFRYAVLGRELEKSVVAYGTAVRFRK